MHRSVPKDCSLSGRPRQAVYIAHRAGLAARGVASSGRRLRSSEVTWDTQAQGEHVVVDGVLYLTDRRGIVRAFGTADHGS